MSLPVDTDIMRMKIAKDMEARHRIEVEGRQQEVDRVSEQYYEARRHNEVLKAQIESLKSETEKEIKDVKDKHRQELQELTLETQALLAKSEDRRDRDLIRQLRRDVDEHKRRCTDLLSEVGDLRKDRDLIKLDRGDIQIKHQRELEELRNQIRVLTSENDRLQFKTSTNDDDKLKLMHKIEKKTQDLSTLHTEKSLLTQALREKDLLIEQMQGQVTILKGETAQAEIMKADMRRRCEEEMRDLIVRERKDKSKLQREIENLTQ
jgi:DNA repair exonuclease SbcCD ATPase subunit